MYGVDHNFRHVDADLQAGSTALGRWLTQAISQTKLTFFTRSFVVEPVNMLEAKSSLSRLVEAVEQGHVAEVLIARNGRPVARLVPLADAPVGRRIGVARGRFVVPDDIDVGKLGSDHDFRP